MVRSSASSSAATPILFIGAALGIVSCVAVKQALDGGGEYSCENASFFVEIRDSAEPVRLRDVLGEELSLPPYAGFGAGLAVTRNHIAAGCPLRSAAGGAAFLYPRPVAPLTQARELAPSGVDGDDEFGGAVALDEETLVVGARLGGPDAEGAAYVYRLPLSTGTPGEALELMAGDPTSGAGFGASVAVDGDVLVVGAPWLGQPFQRSGAAYVFRREGDAWVQKAKLVAQNPSSDAEFGRSVAIEGETIVVGAPLGEDPNHVEKGAVYVFEASDGTWSSESQVRLHPPEPGMEWSMFGVAVDLEGDTLVVGAPLWDAHRGCGHVFERTEAGWSSGAQLLPDDTGDVQQFGCAVAIHGDRMVLGASWDGERYHRAGAAYLFSRSAGAWTQVRKLAPPPESEPPPNFFGTAVALHEDTVVASGGSDTGRVYVLRDVEAKALAVAKDAGGTDEYLAFRTDPRSPGPGSGRITVPRELRAPFRIELTAGLFDAERVDDPVAGRFDFGVEVPGTDPREFVAIEGGFGESGPDLRVVTHEGERGAPISMAGAEILDLAVEHDGSEIVLLARAHGGGTFQEMGRVAAPPEGPLFPFISLAEVPPGTEIGFDDPKLVANAAPAGPGEADGASDLLHQALLLQIEARGDLGAGRPGADARLSESLAKLEAARSVVEAWLAAADGKARKVPRSARKQIVRAGRKVAAALKRIERGKPPAKVQSQIGKALKAEAKALAILRRS